MKTFKYTLLLAALATWALTTGNIGHAAEESWWIYKPVANRYDYFSASIDKLERTRLLIASSMRLSERTREKFSYQVDLRLRDAYKRFNAFNKRIPILSSRVDQVTASGARLFVKSREPATAYYVVVASGSTAPTAAQIKLGQNGSWATVQVRDMRTLKPGWNKFDISGLSASTDYVLYVVTENASGRLRWPVNVTFKTLAAGIDVTAPTLSGLAFTGITATGAVMNFSVNEPGTAYYVILGNGVAAPTAWEVRNGKDANGLAYSMRWTIAVTAGTNGVSLAGFAPNSGYSVYLAAQDQQGNFQTNVMSGNFSTLVLPIPPVFSSVSLSGATATGATLSLVSSGSGNVYYVALPASTGFATPLAWQIRYGLNASGEPAAIRGSYAVVSGTNRIDIAGLSPSTGYVIYLVPSDTTWTALASVYALVALTTSQ